MNNDKRNVQSIPDGEQSAAIFTRTQTGLTLELLMRYDHQNNSRSLNHTTLEGSQNHDHRD